MQIKLKFIPVKFGTKYNLSAGKERLRPILMTTISMVFGMLPLAIASGATSENKNGLGWVIIGGLLSSLLLTLILVPAVYMTMEKIKMKLQNKLARKKASTNTVILES